MKKITVSEAFGNAPPRSAAVLCARDNGLTSLELTDWFTWLNITRNPMISFSLPRTSRIGKGLRNGDSFVLAFPKPEEAERYREPVCAGDGDAETVLMDGEAIRVPRGSQVLLRCTLAGAYHYPFKKVRIFNCNLEEATGTVGRNS